MTLVARPLASAFPAAVALSGLWCFGALAAAGADLLSDEGVFHTGHLAGFLDAFLGVALPTGVIAVAELLAWPGAVLVGIMACAAVLAAVALSSRAATIIGLVCAALAMSVIHLRNPLLSNSSDVLLGQLCIAAAFCVALGGGRLARIGLAFYGALVYVGSVAFKLRGDHWWPEASALERTLGASEITRPLGRALLANASPEMLAAATTGALALEALAPLCVLAAAVSPLVSPMSRGALKTSPDLVSVHRRRLAATLEEIGRASAASLVALHIALLLLLDIGPFPAVCLALWLPLSLRDSRLTAAPSQRPWGFAGPAWIAWLSASAASLCAFLWTPRWAHSGEVHLTLYLAHLKHYWSMFSPAPTHSTRYEFVSEDGSLSDPRAFSPGNAFAIGHEGYAWRVYRDVFWADLWRYEGRAARERGDAQRPRLGADLGATLAERACAAAPEGTLRVSLVALRRENSVETRFRFPSPEAKEVAAVGAVASVGTEERVVVGRAGCPVR